MKLAAQEHCGFSVEATASSIPNVMHVFDDESDSVGQGLCRNYQRMVDPDFVDDVLSTPEVCAPNPLFGDDCEIDVTIWVVQDARWYHAAADNCRMGKQRNHQRQGRTGNGNTSLPDDAVQASVAQVDRNLENSTDFEDQLWKWLKPKWVKILGTLFAVGMGVYWLLFTHIPTLVDRGKSGMATEAAMLTAVQDSERRLTEKVSTIDTKLARLEALIESSKPDFHVRLPKLLEANVQLATTSDPLAGVHAVTALMERANELTTVIDRAVLDRAGEGILRVKGVDDSTLKRSMETTLEYRSSLMVPPDLSQHQRIPDREYQLPSLFKRSTGCRAYGVKRSQSYDVPSYVYALPNIPATGVVTNSEIARIAEDSFSNLDYAQLVYEGCDIEFNRVAAANVTLFNCHVRVTGTNLWVILDNVKFVRCKFTFDADRPVVRSKFFASALADNVKGNIPGA